MSSYTSTVFRTTYSQIPKNLKLNLYKKKLKHFVTRNKHNVSYFKVKTTLLIQ